MTRTRLVAGTALTLTLFGLAIVTGMTAEDDDRTDMKQLANELICPYQADLAETVARARQEGFPLASMLSPDMSAETHRLVVLIYDGARHSLPEMQERAVAEVREAVLEGCLR